MVEVAYIDSVLRTIDDPEMPISIVDLGIVQDVRIETDGRPAGEFAITVDLLPTFVGCPALVYLREVVTSKLRAAGAAAVTVNFVFDPPWSVARISAAGRERLRAYGVSVPARGGCCTTDERDGAGSPNTAAETRAPLPTLVRLELSGIRGIAGLTPDVDPATLYAGTAAREAVACPLCGSSDTALQSPFGPTRCRMIYHCNACRNPFERMKDV